MSMFYSQYVGGQVCCPASATNAALITTYRQLHTQEMEMRVLEETCANKMLQDQITEIQVSLKSFHLHISWRLEEAFHSF